MFDIVISNGRIIDPSQNLDAILNIGITSDRIAALTSAEITGIKLIDAKGLVVAPGFIDTHVNEFTPEQIKASALEGVTTILNTELGTYDIAQSYGSASIPLNFGYNIGHIPVRIKIMGDTGSFLPDNNAKLVASEEKEKQIVLEMQKGLEAGAIGIGFGLMYTPGASKKEVEQIFRLASEYNVSCHVHIRKVGKECQEGLDEVLKLAKRYGVKLHIVHLNSVATKRISTLLDMLRTAQDEGIHVTAASYPYEATYSSIRAAVLDKPKIDYHSLMWPKTGERLTQETFAKYREQGGFVYCFNNTNEDVELAVLDPMTIIASDARIYEGYGHPRSFGTFGSVVGRMVKEKKLTLSQAIDKVSCGPARVFSSSVPVMMYRGNLKLNSYADITIFDPLKYQDNSTYANPSMNTSGVNYLLVNGKMVIGNEILDDKNLAGVPIRR